MEPTEYDGQNDWVGVFLGERCVYKCRPATLPADTNDGRPSKRSAREYLAQVSNHERAIKAHLPRLYRELGIAEEPAFIGWTGGEDTEALRQWLIANRDKQLRVNSPDGQCDCIYSVARRAWEFFWDGDMDEADPAYIDLSDLEGNWTRSDDGTEACTANKYLRVEMGWPEPDPSIISTELGEFRVERRSDRREWAILGAGHVAFATDAWLWDLTRGTPGQRHSARDWVARTLLGGIDGRDPRNDAPIMAMVRALAPVFQRLGIAEEEKPDHYGVEEAEKMVARMRAKMTGTDPGEHRSTVKAEDVGPAIGESLIHRFTYTCGHVVSIGPGERIRDVKPDHACPDCVTRERALKAGESQGAAWMVRGDLSQVPEDCESLCVLPEPVKAERIDKTFRACDEKTQPIRTAYVREKLFAKRSSKPSVYVDWGDDD